MASSTVAQRERRRDRRSPSSRYVVREGDVSVRLRCSGRMHQIVYRPDDRKLLLLGHDLRQLAQELAFAAAGGGELPPCLRILQDWRTMKTLGHAPGRYDLRTSTQLCLQKRRMPERLFDMRVTQKRHGYQPAKDPLLLEREKPETNSPLVGPIAKRTRSHSPLLRSYLSRIITQSEFWRLLTARRLNCERQTALTVATTVIKQHRRTQLSGGDDGFQLDIDPGFWLTRVYNRHLFPIFCPSQDEEVFLVHAELHQHETGVTGLGVGYPLTNLVKLQRYSSLEKQMYWLQADGERWLAQPLVDQLLS